MALVKPQPGARLGCEGPMADPLCHVRSNEEFTSEAPDVGVCDFEGRRHILYSQVTERNKEIPQSTDLPSRVRQKPVKEV